MSGLIHIYDGDGKGKTTAGVGLAVRFAGSGGTVLYAQFLKDDSSSEWNVLEKIPQIELFPCGKNFGFVKNMEAATKRSAMAHYEKYLEAVIEKVQQGNYGLLVLDEILVADSLCMISHDTLLEFLKTKPQELEVVLTGRNPSSDLLKLSDYVSEIRKVKHPYDKGLFARIGIEK